MKKGVGGPRETVTNTRQGRVTTSNVETTSLGLHLMLYKVVYQLSTP